MSIGFRDKLYWRPSQWGWCCLKHQEGGGYISLCGRTTRKRCGGQLTARPPVVLRCPICDGKEIDRRKMSASILCVNEDWKSFLPPQS